MPAKPKVPPPPIDLQTILQVLQAAPKPLSATVIAGHLGLKPAALKPALASLVESAQIFNHTKTTYWHSPKPIVLSPAQLLAKAAEVLLQLSTTDLLSTAELKARATAQFPNLKSKMAAAHKELLAANLLREVPLPGSKSKISVNVQHPEPYLQHEISHLLTQFSRSRSPEDIQAFLLGQAPPASLQPQADIAAIAETLFATMNRIAFEPGATVNFYRLRQQPELANTPKLLFDQAALLLREQKRVLLASHGHALSLPQHEQDELVTDGHGNFYVSIYAL